MSAASQKSESALETKPIAAEIKINIGCGGAWKVAGWFGLDQGSTSEIWQSADDPQFIDLDVKRGLPFPTNSVAVVFSSHALEHFTYEEGTALLFEIYRVLKVGAPLCLVVPDMDLYITNYVARNRDFLTVPQIIGGTPRNNLADNFLMNFYSDPKFNNTCHKYAYNFENLSSALLDIGFAEVEKVPFHEFSYWPELREQEFRSPIPHIEAFSLSVQCRKVAFDTKYRERTEYKEARQFSRFREDEQQLSQQLNAALLLNQGLHAQLQHALAEINARNADIDTRNAQLGILNDELAARRSELETMRSQVEAMRSQVERAGSESQALREELEKSAAEARHAEERLEAECEAHSVSKLELRKLNSKLLEKTSEANQIYTRLDDISAGKAESDRLLRNARARQTASKMTSGLVHYLREGASKGLTPSPRFDGNWYLEQNPDVAKSAVNPLLHYVMSGAAERRAPNPIAKLSGGDYPVPLQVVTSEAGPDARSVLVANDATRKAVVLSRADPLTPGASVTLYSPVFSIVVPTYNTPLKYLQELLQSVRCQTYTAWELCIIDDGSTDSRCISLLKDLPDTDPRIQLRLAQQNRGIAESSQQGLEMATGEFVAFLDHDDVLAPNALLEAVQLLRTDLVADVIYTDHASLDDNGVLNAPALKPDWSPEFFFSTNYLAHFIVVRRSLAVELGGFKDTIPSAQDTGLLCKLVERGASIRHLPKILYYWRAHTGSVASSVSAKPSIALATIQTYNECLERRGVPAKVTWPDAFRKRKVGAYKLDFSHAPTRSAIVIPYAGHGVNLGALANSLKRTAGEEFPPVHCIQISSDAETTAMDAFIWRTAENQTQFDEIINGIDCETLIFLSSGGLIVSSTWLSEITGYLKVSPEIGAVGGKVLNQWLSVRTGGIVLLSQPTSICREESDDSDGHWFRGRLASNVEAVSSKLMATPKDVYFRCGGLPVFQYGESAGIPYGLRLRAAGYRVVYNPWSKIVDTADESLSSDLGAVIEKEYGQAATYDRYYHPFFSRDAPYWID